MHRRFARRRVASGEAGKDDKMIQESWPKTFPWSKDQVRRYTDTYSQKIIVKGSYFSRMWVAVLSFLINLLSWKWTDRFGAFIGWLMYRFGLRRSVAMINLDIAFRDTKSKKEKEEIYRKSLISFGRQILTYFRFPKMDEKFWAENYGLDNEHFLREALNKGKGAIILGMHFSNWELGLGKLGFSGYPSAIVGRPMGNPVFHKFLIDSRAAINISTIPNKNSMNRIFEGLKRGETVAMAIDQNMTGNHGVFVEWLGWVACTVASVSWIIRESGSPAIGAYSLRVGPGKFKLVLTEEVKWEPYPENPEKELVVNTQNQVRALEKVILQQPELWLWIHKRWKTQPPGMPNPYKQ